MDFRKVEMPVLEPETRGEAMLKSDFLRLLKESGQVAECAAELGLSKKQVYAWRAKDQEFADRWDELVNHTIVPQLEQEAVRRALNGSDLLLIFLLKAHKRAFYDDRYVQAQQTPAIRLEIRDVDMKVLAQVNNLEAPKTPTVDYSTGRQVGVLDESSERGGIFPGEVSGVESSSVERAASTAGADTLEE